MLCDIILENKEIKMTENLERFEKFLKNKQQFLKDMLLVIHDKEAIVSFQIQLDLLDDIIHHYDVLVKGELSGGMGVKYE
jgi:hypothetical protein